MRNGRVWPAPEGRERHGRQDIRRPTPKQKQRTKGKKERKNSPPYQILSLPTQMHVVGDDKIVRPVDDLLIRLVRSLRTKGRVSNETLKHDRAQRPPVALVSIALLQKDLGRDIIRRPDGRIGLTQRNKSGSPFRRIVRKKFPGFKGTNG